MTNLLLYGEDNNSEDFIFERLGICSCGHTSGQVEFINNYLTALNRDDVDLRKAQAINTIIKNPEVAYEILNHFLTNTDLVEYGGSVTYAWFNRAGDNLDFLKRLSDFMKELGND